MFKIQGKVERIEKKYSGFQEELRSIEQQQTALGSIEKHLVTDGI